MLQSDLLDDPLSSAEKEKLSIAWKETHGNIQETLQLLSPKMAIKTKRLLQQGLKLSFELNKLQQRGISILFPKESEIGHIKNLFCYEPTVLFAVGNQELLDDERVNIALSLASFKRNNCNGIFVADRAFDSLLRDRYIVTSLRETRGLLISDSLKSCANVKLSFREKEEHYTEKPKQCPRKKYVFISGSRSQTVIPKTMQDSIETIIKREFSILIGDSNKGVDKEVLDFLRAPLYKDVTIFTISPTPRIKAEDDWNIRIIAADKSLAAQRRQIVKDRAMADAADWGMVLFNPIEKNRYGSLQVSSGTLRNTIQMLLQGKMVKFFYIYEQDILSKNLKGLNDLEGIITSYRTEKLTEPKQRDILLARGVSPTVDAAQVKSEKILAKYKTLRRREEKILTTGSKDIAPVSMIQGTFTLFN